MSFNLMRWDERECFKTKILRTSNQLVSRLSQSQIILYSVYIMNSYTKTIQLFHRELTCTWALFFYCRLEEVWAKDNIEYWPELDVSEKYSLRISQLVDWDRFWHFFKRALVSEASGNNTWAKRKFELLLPLTY